MDTFAAAAGQHVVPPDMGFLVEVMGHLEACGNVCGMASMLEEVSPHVEALGTDDDLRILERVRMQVAQARERETLAGGHGSLFDPNHPVNIAARSAVIHDPQWRPWWEVGGVEPTLASRSAIDLTSAIATGRASNA